MKCSRRGQRGATTSSAGTRCRPCWTPARSQWRLIFALSRYGGLRCPSEHLGLPWGDVDLDAGRMLVRSPKTERHEGKAERVVPIFPELRPYLQAVRDELLADDFDP